MWCRCGEVLLCAFSCGGFVIPHERVLGFVIRKKIPIYKVATEQPPAKVKPFRACGFGIRTSIAPDYKSIAAVLEKIPIYKSATEQPPVKVKPCRACGFGNPHLNCAGLQIRRSGKSPAIEYHDLYFLRAE